MGGMRYGAVVAPAVLSGRRWGRLTAGAVSRVGGRSSGVGPPIDIRVNPRSAASPVIVAAVVLALVAGACGGGERSPVPEATSSTTVPNSTTSSTVLSAQQATVFDAYLRCWKAYIDFGTEQNRSFTRADFDARVGGCMTGEQYTKLLHGFSNGRPQGVFFRGPGIEHDPRPEVELNGAAATVRDCMLDQGEVFDADDGRVLDAASGARTLNVVSLALVDGTWRIAGAKDEGPCVA